MMELQGAPTTRAMRPILFCFEQSKLKTHLMLRYHSVSKPVPHHGVGIQRAQTTPWNSCTYRLHVARWVL